MLLSFRAFAGRARRLLSQYHPGTAFAPVSDSMLVALSMQHAISDAVSHTELVKQLESSGLLRSDAVRRAFAAVDRAKFVPDDLTDPKAIYANKRIRYGASGSLCSPSMHAIVSEHLSAAIGTGKRALDLGTGTGFMAVIMAEMGSDHVDAVDIDGVLVAQVTARHPHPRICWRTDDAFRLALPAGAYDCIHIGASVEFVPDSWLALLNSGGTMIVPIGRVDCEQTLMKLTKSADSFDCRDIVSRDAIQSCKYEAMRSESSGSVRQWVSTTCRYLLEQCAQENDEIKLKIQEWHRTFLSSFGRKPSLNDIKSDDRVSDLLSRYRQQLKYRRL